MKEQEQKTNSRGITLIALIITIVILLILAGIVLGTLKGRNGIIKKADEADLKTTHLGVKERMEFLALQRESYRDETDFIEYLKSKGYIDDDGIINIKKVFDKGSNYGNGTNEKDVYKIVKDDKYLLNYYDKSGVATEIWSMKNDTISVGDNDASEDRVEGSNVTWIYEEDSNGDLIITGVGDFKLQVYAYNIVAESEIETLKIPSHIANKKVVEVSWKLESSNVDPKWYKWHGNQDKIWGVKEIIYSNTIKKISSDVGFEDLTNVIIPNSVVSISSDTFDRCPNVTVTLQKGSTLEIPANKWGAKDVIREQ